jgi:hypothetical protein
MEIDNAMYARIVDVCGWPTRRDDDQSPANRVPLDDHFLSAHCRIDVSGPFRAELQAGRRTE